MHEGHQDLLEGIDKEKPKEKKGHHDHDHHGHDHHDDVHEKTGMSEGLKRALIVLAVAGVLIIVFRMFS